MNEILITLNEYVPKRYIVAICAIIGMIVATIITNLLIRMKNRKILSDILTLKSDTMHVLIRIEDNQYRGSETQSRKHKKTYNIKNGGYNVARTYANNNRLPANNLSS